jgi:hypothetical protein
MPKSRVRKKKGKKVKYRPKKQNSFSPVQLQNFLNLMKLQELQESSGIEDLSVDFLKNLNKPFEELGIDEKSEEDDEILDTTEIESPLDPEIDDEEISELEINLSNDGFTEEELNSMEEYEDSEDDSADEDVDKDIPENNEQSNGTIE